MGLFATGRSKQKDTEGNLNEDPAIPTGKQLWEILQKSPQACTEEEKSFFRLYTDLALPCLNSDFALKVCRDSYWLKFSPSDLAWALYAFQFQAPKDAPVEEVVASSDSSQASSLSSGSGNRTTPKGNQSQRRNKRRKICVGTDKRESVKFYFITKAEISTFVSAADGAKTMKEWSEEINRGDLALEEEQENVEPSTAAAAASKNVFAKDQGLAVLLVSLVAEV